MSACALELENVTREFGAGDGLVRAVDGASLAVSEGEIVLVMGPSGSGKTTLLAMAGGLLSPTSGRIRLGDHELTALSRSERAEVRLRSVGFVFQVANLLANLTALENVRIVLDAAGTPRRESKRRARDLLAELGLSHRLMALPETLSGGERQRVAIARALANRPSLLLADEPTANLDSKMGYQLMHMLEVLAKERGLAVVAVTHDPRIQDVAERLLWLDDGKLRTTPAESAELARDPVCGMTIDISRAAGTRVIGGETFYFCSMICLDRFDRSAARATPPVRGADG